MHRSRALSGCWLRVGKNFRLNTPRPVLIVVVVVVVVVDVVVVDDDVVVVNVIEAQNTKQRRDSLKERLRAKSFCGLCGIRP